MSNATAASIRADFSAAAGQYEAYAQLQQRMAEEVAALARALLTRQESPRVLDAGCGTGFLVASLAQTEPNWQLLALDFAPAMCATVHAAGHARNVFCADMSHLPFADASLDAIVSSAAVQWAPDTAALFAEWARVLKPGGLIVFSSFGPGTLQELRRAFAAVDTAPHVQEFLGLSALKDAASSAGLASLQANQRIEHLPYASPRALMQQLKAIGARNKRVDRKRGLMTPRALAAVDAAYPKAKSGNHILAAWEVMILALQKDA